MTLATVEQPADGPTSAPPSRRGRRLVVGASLTLVLAAGGIIGSTYYFDSVPLVESSVSYPVVAVPDLSPTVTNAFVAAVDPDFYASNDSLLTRQYVMITSGEESGLRTRIMARKAEGAYTKAEILDLYLNRADFGRGAVGLVAAAQTYFQKPATELTVAEAALLAAQLDPDHPEPKAGWNEVLDTMVAQGWLTAADRDGLAFPG